MTRRVISVRGIVQGVGFRPFVYGLASRLSLGGFVRNQHGQVRIEVEGDAAVLDEFIAILGRDPPPLARIDGLTWDDRPPLGERRFRIEESGVQVAGPIFLSPDVATCDDCLRELFDPNDRRYRYPFVNCVNCGPRLTIITGAPYDRERTTMAAFGLCAACRREYEDPADRRFHAEPIACPACGPRLTLLDNAGREMVGDDAIRDFAVALLSGRIGAVKGIGGFHLACDATDAVAVRTLRHRKHRDEKPFAIMVADLAEARLYCEISDSESNLLTSPRRPIVLLRKRSDLSSIEIADDVAPANPFLGVVLPYTPLHHLLMREMDERPLVMTSGNRSDEPIAYENDDALARLADVADLFLVHDRPIHVRCDDSVTRIVAGGELPVRRSRGDAPRPIELPFSCARNILAVGGQLKATFALGRESSAIVSHHLGDLDHLSALQAFERDIELYVKVFDCEPSVVAHDLHPDYASTLWSAAARHSKVAVQHHHAHVASCMAENGLDGTVIGVSFDGAGYGSDGAIWGGEFLVGGYRSVHRAAHLRYVRMPGGERATREPWRMALAYLLDAGVSPALVERRIAAESVRTCRVMLERGFNSPITSSIGRLFDAVASLCGIRDRVSHEGQAAMELEWRATASTAEGTYPFDVVEMGETLVLDPRPTIAAIVRDVERQTDSGAIGRRFHATCADMIATVCGRIRATTGLGRIVLTGGVFANALLTDTATARLTAADFTVERHRLVPPGDGGLSLGQLAVAACHAPSPPGAPEDEGRGAVGMPLL